MIKGKILCFIEVYKLLGRLNEQRNEKMDGKQNKLYCAKQTKTDSKSSAIEKLMCNIYKSGDEMENMHKKQKKIMGKL